MLLRNKLRVVFLTVLALGVAAGCAYPTSSLHQGGQRPAIGFSGAPPNALVVIDGITMGKANDYDGVNTVLVLESGPHTVTLRQGDKVIFQQQIYLGSSETRIIPVDG